MKVEPRRSGSNADVPTSCDINRTGWCAGPDAERQAGTAGDIADEEVGLVARNVPGLCGKTAGGCLFKTMGGRVASRDVKIQCRRGSPKSNLACATYLDCVGRCTSVYFKYNRPSLRISRGALIYKSQETGAAA